MKTRSGDPHIVQATKGHIPLIREFILELAEYERAKPEKHPSPKGSADTLFGKRPAAEVLIAYVGDEPAGFALFFHNYSTWLASAESTWKICSSAPAAETAWGSRCCGRWPSRTRARLRAYRLVGAHLE